MSASQLVETELLRYGYARDYQVDNEFGLEVSTNLPLVQFEHRLSLIPTRVRYSLMQWHQHIGLGDMIHKIIVNNGWNRNTWTKITQLHMVLDWPEEYLRRNRHYPINWIAFETAAFNADYLEEFILQEF